MRHITLAIALGIALLVAEAARADKAKIDPDVVRTLVAKGELMALEEILLRNEKEIVGRIIEIELERKSIGYVYEIKVLRPDGRKIELKINGQTGILIATHKK